MRLQILLSDVEMAALEKLAEAEFRGLSQQASKIVVDELRERGLLEGVEVEKAD